MTAELTTERLAEIRERATSATEGPWYWHGNTDTHNAYLSGGHGKRTVMAFARWGMRNAQPMFCDADSYLVKASEIPVYAVAPDATHRNDPRVYRANVSGFRNPDAVFIASARQDVDDLLAEIDRLRAELAATKRSSAFSITPSY